MSNEGETKELLGKDTDLTAEEILMRDLRALLPCCVEAYADLRFGSDIYRTPGWYHLETSTFIWERADGALCDYYVTTIRTPPFVYRLILGEVMWLGSVYLLEN